MNLTELNKSINTKRKNAILLETLNFQKRLAARLQEPDYPFYEKLTMIKIIFNNINEHFTMKLSKAGRKVNQIAKYAVEALYNELDDYILGEISKYLEEIGNPDNMMSEIGRIVEEASVKVLYPYYKEANQVVILTNVSDDSLSPEFFENHNLNIDEYERFQWIRIPGLILNIDKVINLLKMDMYKDKYSFPPVEINSSVYSLSDVFEKDIVFRTPYHSYDAVLYFMEQCLMNPYLDMIFMTLYRTADNSKIVQLLCEYGKRSPYKYIGVFVEPNASGDEAKNSQIVKTLRQNGVHVFYENDFKIHSKLFLATSTSKSLYFAHFATGNYNENSAKCYTDIHLLTADTAKVIPALNMFLQHVCKSGISSTNIETNRIWFSPINLKSTLLGLIKSETNKGSDGKIILKMNSLADQEIIDYLVEAADHGVNIKIIVRSICLMDSLIYPNIQIESYCGRYLEHDRIYQFGDRVFIASADLSFRNLHKRIESLIEIDQENSKSEVLSVLNELRIINKYRFVKNPNYEDDQWECIPNDQ